MELFLNLGWALSAALLVCIWLRFAARTGASRQTQLVALALLVLILFPVISVTDDLQAMQNPAEVDSCQRRGHAGLCAHAILAPVAALPSPVFSVFSEGLTRLATPAAIPSPVFDQPGLAPIQNRPPPVA